MGAVWTQRVGLSSQKSFADTAAYSSATYMPEGCPTTKVLF